MAGTESSGHINRRSYLWMVGSPNKLREDAIIVVPIGLLSYQSRDSLHLFSILPFELLLATGCANAVKRILGKMEGECQMAIYLLDVP